MTSDAVHLAGRFVASRHPKAIAAILAGSRARAVASSASDYDVVLLFDPTWTAGRDFAIENGRNAGG